MMALYAAFMQTKNVKDFLTPSALASNKLKLNLIVEKKLFVSAVRCKWAISVSVYVRHLPLLCIFVCAHDIRHFFS